eukprot:jgi/Mesen1/9826/ME000007S09882
MDPLSMLREYTIRKELDQVQIVGDECRFGDAYRFPKHLDTAFRSRAGGLYPLDSLVLFVKNINAKHTEYMQLARSAKLQNVIFTDRKPLQEYLEGKIATTDQIELLPPLPAPASISAPPASLGRRRDNDAQDDLLGVPAPKKARAMAEGGGAAGGERADLAAGGKAGGSLLPGGGGGGGSDSLAADMAAPRLSSIEIILARERPLRDREAILRCGRRDAFAGVLAMLHRREDERKKIESAKKEAQQKGADPEKDSGPGDGAGASARHADEKGGRLSSSSGRKDYQDAKEEKQRGQQQPQQDPRSTSSHRPQHPHRPLSDPATAPRRGGGGGQPPAPPHQQPQGCPIILVPSAAQTLVNMCNVKDFLELGQFVPLEDASMAGARKRESVEVQRVMGRSAAKPVPFLVLDKPSTLKPKDWERVVAVFVLGKEWQFKDWPFKGGHTEIFTKIMGVFLRYDDASVESAAAVRNWNVKIIAMSRHKRHQDRTAALQFWDHLDSFLRARKSTLRF